jgi:hypothetical protein
VEPITFELRQSLACCLSTNEPDAAGAEALDGEVLDELVAAGDEDDGVGDCAKAGAANTTANAAAVRVRFIMLVLPPYVIEKVARQSMQWNYVQLCAT